MHIELAWFGGLFRRTKAEWKSRFSGCIFSQGLMRFVFTAAYSLQLTCWLGRNSLCGVVANFGSFCYCFYRSICRHWHCLSTWLHNSNFAPRGNAKQVWGCPFDKTYSAESGADIFWIGFCRPCQGGTMLGLVTLITQVTQITQFTHIFRCTCFVTRELLLPFVDLGLCL